MNNTIKFPIRPTPDQREEKLQRRRVADQKRREKRIQESPTIQIMNIFSYMAFDADNQNMSRCNSCRQFTETRPGFGYRCRYDRCMVCDAPKSVKRKDLL